MLKQFALWLKRDCRYEPESVGELIVGVFILVALMIADSD